MKKKNKIHQKFKNGFLSGVVNSFNEGNQHLRSLCQELPFIEEIPNKSKNVIMDFKINTSSDSAKAILAKELQQAKAVIAKKDAVIEQKDKIIEELELREKNRKKLGFLDKIIDLGEPLYDPPSKIPSEKQWSADWYKENHPEWTPEQKVRHYLKTHWMNYRITRGFLGKHGAQNFYKYLHRKKILYIVPTLNELQIKKSLSLNK